jgi:hypothetical protein
MSTNLQQHEKQVKQIYPASAAYFFLLIAIVILLGILISKCVPH